MPYPQADLLASLIEEEDWTASLGETLYQVARRVERQTFGERRPGAGRTRCSTRSPTRCGRSRRRRRTRRASRPRRRRACLRCSHLRERCLKLGADLPWAERGAILTLLGSAERAFYLIERIDAERRSVSRDVPAPSGRAVACAGRARRRAVPVPAE